MNDRFSVNISGDDRATMLTLTGELDLASSEQLEEALARVRDWGTALVVLDLRELTFMDSTGLHLLVEANQRAREGGPQFQVISGGPQVQRLLSITGVDRWLTLIDAPDQPLRAS
ncbi:MAG: STAS domain-containing protein [Mycobacteriales bacterium]